MCRFHPSPWLGISKEAVSLWAQNCLPPTPHPVAQTVENLPVIQETRVQSLGQKDPLEKGMAIHSSILAWRISWTEKPGGLQSMGSQRVRHNWLLTRTHTHTHTHRKKKNWAFREGRKVSMYEEDHVSVGFELRRICTGLRGLHEQYEKAKW